MSKLEFIKSMLQGCKDAYTITKNEKLLTVISEYEKRISLLK